MLGGAAASSGALTSSTWKSFPWGEWAWVVLPQAQTAVVSEMGLTLLSWVCPQRTTGIFSTVAALANCSESSSFNVSSVECGSKWIAHRTMTLGFCFSRWVRQFRVSVTRALRGRG